MINDADHGNNQGVPLLVPGVVCLELISGSIENKKEKISKMTVIIEEIVPYSPPYMQSRKCTELYRKLPFWSSA